MLTSGIFMELPFLQATAFPKRREPKSTSIASLLSLLRGIVMLGASIEMFSSRTIAGFSLPCKYVTRISVVLNICLAIPGQASDGNGTSEKFKANSLISLQVSKGKIYNHL